MPSVEFMTGMPAPAFAEAEEPEADALGDFGDEGQVRGASVRQAANVATPQIASAATNQRRA